MTDSRNTHETIVLLAWDTPAGAPKLRRVPQRTTVPPPVWDALNRVFLARLRRGRFNPLDPADAYQYAVQRLLAAAERTSLAGPDRVAYLVAAAGSFLDKFCVRFVMPAQQNARELARWHANAAPHATQPDDASDTDALLATLPQPPRTDTARREAAKCLAELFPHLPREIRRAFAAYLAADGHLAATAARLKMPLRTFMRKWPQYLACARQIAHASHVQPPKKTAN